MRKLMNLGNLVVFLVVNFFENRRRVYYCVFHLDLINGKVWIQVDATDVPIAHRLEAAGVPKEDIVLGFHAPYKRTLEGYAAA